MLPQDVTHEVWREVQEAFFTQRAESGPVHAELMKVDILQTELIHRPC